MFLNPDFFLETKTARKLYHETAAALPIIDFHTHLDQQAILEDRRFSDLAELWLAHDHYKWRLMRACGVAEKFITGDATPWEKFHAFARIMPLAIANPVHQWAHMELRSIFGIDDTLNEKNARTIWDRANEIIANDPQLSVRGLLSKFKVRVVCTTDDPCADLSTHAAIQAANDGIQVFPTFRPDRFLEPTPDAKLELAGIVGFAIEDQASLIKALQLRHQYFHDQGCRLSDHGLSSMPVPGTAAFEVFQHIARWNHDKGWTMQLHLGPQRNVNSSMFAITGRDSGFDTMGSWPQTAPLIAALDELQKNDSLGRVIVYNLNPNESAAICCALQNFQNSLCAGKLQYGPAWWHLDHKKGILEQIELVASLGALGTSVGMLTDSRSFTSYVRHDYYRRLLCQYLGSAVEAGEIPSDLDDLQSLVANICYHNAASYFNWSQPIA
ncbi:glucuronate isomerase [Luteolibacter pohnpeiensis]|uniref:Uronate isomerase n=1 Tax=Luteolibacter pohnpeiensis TaxID=454153 RepID=A0A934SAH0_9BACT|nr:glucuronate isomerase [Luteolibacter pohnpeiensis]MBK1882627.1 glucuronate isomerase [Luteolibacter pohnpeiensis]